MKIFLFDFDGVINDTLPIAVEVYNSLMTKYEIQTKFTRKTFAELFQESFHKGLAKIIPDTTIREEILEERGEEYIRRQDDFRIFTGMKQRPML